MTSLTAGKAASRLQPSADFSNAVTTSRAGQAVLPGWMLHVWLDISVLVHLLRHPVRVANLQEDLLLL